MALAETKIPVGTDAASTQASIWLPKSGEGWAAWRVSWGVWLGNGVLCVAPPCAALRCPFTHPYRH